MIILNAKIDSADIVFSRGFALDCWLFLSFDGSQQGFGGYVLGGNPFDSTAKCSEHQNQKNLAADFIGGVLAVAGVEKFSDLAGKIIRVEKTNEWGDITGIGHPIKDIWYRPAERLASLVDGAA